MSKAASALVTEWLAKDQSLPPNLRQRLANPRFPASDRERWKYTDARELLTLIERSVDVNDATYASWPASFAAHAANYGIKFDDALRFENGRWQVPATIPTGLQFDSSELASDFDDRFTQSDLNAIEALLPPQHLHAQIAADSNLSLHVVYGMTAATTLYRPRLDIELCRGATLTLTEHFIDDANHADYFCNHASDIDVATDARLVHRRINLLGANARLLCDSKLRLQSSAHAELLSIDLGAKLARNETTCVVDGAGAHVRTAGIALGGQTQQIDNIVTMDHQHGDASSEQDYVSVLADRATSVFKGKVYVADGADGTDSKQSSRNLLLSDKATVNTMPELEIYADDVKCAHGATTGQLDEAALFYLCSRGIREADARDLLIRAFADKTLSSINDAALREQLSGLIGERLNTLIPQGAKP